MSRALLMNGDGKRIDCRMAVKVALRQNPVRECPQEIINVQRVMTVQYVSMRDGTERSGQLVVHQEILERVRSIFKQLLSWRFPIQSVIPIVAFDWNDLKSMEANNTSGFNYRTIAGRSELSQHAYGLAIDINPLQNPCISGEKVVPSGAVYDPRVPGTITPDSSIVALFRRAGAVWGGDFVGFKDYHHFEFRL